MGSNGVTNPPNLRVGVFGCLIGCLSYSSDDSETQASIEPTVGGGIEVCEKPPEPQMCEVENKPEDGCGMYDQNCDNQLQYPGAPVPKKAKVGAIVGASYEADGSICYQFGVFGSAPLPAIDLGGISE